MLKTALSATVSVIAYTLLLALNACSPTTPPSALHPWAHSYKCMAISRSAHAPPAVGWSTQRQMARAHALEKCRAHSHGPLNCRIAYCIDEGELD